MTNFYVENLHIQRDGVATITTKQIKESTGDEESPEPQQSKDILIKLSTPRLLPQLTAALLACWINLSTGASLGYVTPALPSLQASSSRLQINDAQGSWVAAIILLGALVGGLLSGPFISIGRRKALWVTSVPLGVAWILIAASPNVTLLYSGHLMLGICLGVISDASQIYVSECASTQWRGALGCVPVLMFNAGMLTCYIAGAWLNWEELAIFGAVLTLPAIFLPFAIPESPSYLMAKGETEQAIGALQWLRGAGWDVTLEYQELLHCEKTSSLLTRLRGLCDRETLLPLLLTFAIRVLSRFCGLRAIQSYTHSILEQSHSSLDSKTATIIIGAVQLIATLIACLLLEKLGRRRLLIGSQVVMAMSLIGLACWLYLRNDLNGTGSSLFDWTPVTFILIYIVANSIGIGPVSGIIIGELVPQRHRSIASSITGSISWLSAFIVTKTFLDIKSGLHLYGTLWLYASICLVGIPLVYFCLPETRGISQYGIEVLFKVNKTPNSGEKNRD